MCTEILSPWYLAGQHIMHRKGSLKKMDILGAMHHWEVYCDKEYLLIGGCRLNGLRGPTYAPLLDTIMKAWPLNFGTDHDPDPGNLWIKGYCREWCSLTMACVIGGSDFSVSQNNSVGEVLKSALSCPFLPPNSVVWCHPLKLLIIYTFVSLYHDSHSHNGTL